MTINLLLLIALVIFFLRGKITFSLAQLNLWPVKHPTREGEKALLVFEFQWSGHCVDEWRPSPNAKHETMYGLHFTNGWTPLGIRWADRQKGLILFNCFIGYWIDEDFYYNNKSSWWGWNNK